jgi:hypothetical protein
VCRPAAPGSYCDEVVRHKIEGGASVAVDIEESSNVESRYEA